MIVFTGQLLYYTYIIVKTILEIGRRKLLIRRPISLIKRTKLLIVLTVKGERVTVKGER